MADCTGLSRYAAACHTADNVELLVGLGEHQRLTHDQLEGLETEIIVDVTIVDRHLAGALVQAHTGDGALSSASSVKIRRFLVHSSVPPL